MQFSHILCLLSVSAVLAFPVTQDNTLATVGSDSTDFLDIRDGQNGGNNAGRAVKRAVRNFANDANTVSSSLNQLATATDAQTIKDLASTGFSHESDENAQRSVLFQAAGAAGSHSNDLIVKNTPIVLTGLQNIINDPTVETTKSNLKTIQDARNPNILPSITQLSNAALAAEGLPQNAQFFPPTGQGN